MKKVNDDSVGCCRYDNNVGMQSVTCEGNCKMMPSTWQIWTRQWLLVQISISTLAEAG